MYSCANRSAQLTGCWLWQIPRRLQQGVYDGFALLRGQFWKHGQRQYARRGLFGEREITAAIAQILARFLEMNRNRVMNSRGDAALIQKFLDGGAIFDLQHIEMENVSAIFGDLRQHERSISKGCAVCRGMLISQRVPAIEVLELYTQNRGLNRVQP